jgi:MATE family multidrug resistance protein
MSLAAAPDLTHRRVLKIALPIVAANVTVPLLGLVDTAVIGQMGQAAPIGAVGLGAIILAVFYWMFGFLRMGTTGLAAQAHGAGDGPEAGAILKRGLLIAGAAGLAMIALQGVLFGAAFRVAPASDQVEALASQYLAIRIWGAPATIASYALTGWLIAIERTRAVLVLQLVTNGANIGLDVWFVLGLGWGVPGVAAAAAPSRCPIPMPSPALPPPIPIRSRWSSLRATYLPMRLVKMHSKKPIP